MAKKTSKDGKTGFDRFIFAIERIGNKLPSPFWLFVLLIAVVIVASVIMSAAGVSVTYMKASKVATEAPTETTIYVNNLLSRENIQYLFTNLTSIYAGFAPLGLVIIMMLGIGFLEKTGCLNSLIRKTLLGAPEALMIAIIAFVGVNANLASDAGILVVSALAGAMFKAMGKNPWIGIIAGYCAANGGFSANVFIAGTDALLSGITESVCNAVGIEAPVHAMMNWYFMIAATFVITGATVFVTKFFMEKNYGHENLSYDSSALEKQALTENEKKGLKYAGIASLAYVAVILCMLLPKNAILRSAEGKIVPKSPFLSGIITVLFLLFFIAGLAYAKGAKVIKSLDEVPKLMQEAIRDTESFIVIALPASVFITLFDLSNIATVIGTALGTLLESVNLTGFPLLLVFIFITTCMNLFVTSGSVKWLVLAPIFVPVMARLGLSPALTQITYRVADTCTNIISPIDYYVPVIMGLLGTYDTQKRKIGIGTVISLCMPYAIAYLICMITLLGLWILFKLPVGPGAPLYL